ncbi:MAG TPA: alpha-glucan family phosphorylase [Thermoanaerobaculia bacterium]
MTETDGTFQKLRELAQNLWWSWQPDIRAIFRELDPVTWRVVYHNPVALLQRLDPQEVADRVQDLELQTRINQVHRRLRQYLQGNESWGATHAGPILAFPVAYFSAEFGLHQSLPIYSGGLGVLAGDHLKSMSDLGVPVVGVGLLYHQGYVHQLIDENGWQQDLYEPIGAAELPVDPVLGADGQQVRFAVELPGRDVWVRLWRVAAGRSLLLLLDARDDANTPEDQELTARLYGGDQETRIQQEILLGVGGFRALGQVGIKPSVLHLNEGHSAFALLERARHFVEHQGLDPDAAVREVAATSVFTTHTPVEAGHDRFRPELAGRHLEALAQGLGMPLDRVLALGSERPDDPAAPFCPTVLALNLSRRSNGVSALHGRVSRRMWHSLYPGRTEEEVPIGHITNGVHVRTWLAADMHDLYSRYLGPRWLESLSRPDLWTRAEKIPDAEIWEVHQVLKARLLTFVRRRLADRRERLGLPAPEREPLEPEALTLGFARRFATYKRADILFQDLDRLARLVNDPQRPVQIVFAGKAHPRDTGGKALAQRVANLERDPRFAGRIVFVENYSIHVGRQLVQGVDVWLNTPRRPLEACGTSGEKCILNGVLNCSILDGWWAEGYDGQNGFAVGAGEIHSNPDLQDERDALALFETLETQVVPLYYDRDAQGLPKGWIRRVKRAIRTLAWRYNADRMVMDYVNQCYLPAAGGETCRMPVA